MFGSPTERDASAGKRSCGNDTNRLTIIAKPSDAISAAAVAFPSTNLRFATPHADSAPGNAEITSAAAPVKKMKPNSAVAAESGILANLERLQGNRRRIVPHQLPALQQLSHNVR